MKVQEALILSGSWLASVIVVLHTHFHLHTQSPHVEESSCNEGYGKCSEVKRSLPTQRVQFEKEHKKYTLLKKEKENKTTSVLMFVTFNEVLTSPGYVTADAVTEVSHHILLL